MFLAKQKYLEFNVFKEGSITNLNVSIIFKFSYTLTLMATMTQGLPWHA
jgi:hypothetical protein